jgi:alkylation response protein AidB-like acyl-CoA dehydrogenase
MEFAFTDEQRMIAETARAYFAEHATSGRTRAAMAQTGPEAGIDAGLWQGYCRDLGFSGIGIAEDLGGAGLGMVELAILGEAAGTHVAAMPMLGSLAQAAQAIAAGGSDEQRRTVLPLLLSGEHIGGWFDDADLAERDGLIHATGRFVPHGGAAHQFVVSSADRAWLVAADAPGVAVTVHTTMDQTRPFATVALRGVRGEPLTDGIAAVRAARNTALMMVAAEALGGAQACLDRTVAYARERIQFGRPIGSFQAYKHRLADMMVDIEQARSAVYWAACALDEASAEADFALSAAKSFAADTFFHCAAMMIQLHGGIGFTWEHDAHLYFKRARAIQSMLGSSAWHRERLATMILGEAA